MRDIKFRGLCSNGIMRYGRLSQDREDSTTYYKTHSQRICWDYSNIPVSNISLGQYIGLVDKNETEIYEGDIIDFENLQGDIVRGFVTFRDGCFRVSNKIGIVNKWDGEVRMWNDGNNEWYSIENIESFDVEIIGNIHTSPELLTQ